MQKRTPTRKRHNVEVTGVLKLSKMEEKGPTRESYWSETFDLSAQCKDGTKVFEAFHIIAVPEGQLETFDKLRKQVREHMAFDVHTIQNLDQKCSGTE